MAHTVEEDENELADAAPAPFSKERDAFIAEISKLKGNVESLEAELEGAWRAIDKAEVGIKTAVAVFTILETSPHLLAANSLWITHKSLASILPVLAESQKERIPY